MQGGQVKVSRRKRRLFLRVKTQDSGIMMQAWLYNRRGMLVKHVMRYKSFDEWTRTQ